MIFMLAVIIRVLSNSCATIENLHGLDKKIFARVSSKKSFSLFLSLSIRQKMAKNIRYTVAMIVCIVCCLCIITTKSANILAILPTPSYSHQIPYQILWTTLSQRGHKVVVITTDPINDPSLKNLTEVNLQSSYYLMRNLKLIGDDGAIPWFNILRGQIWQVSQDLASMIYEHPEVQKLYVPDSDEKFDVVIIETFTLPSLYPLAYRFNAPLIGLLSLGIASSQYYIYGAPVLPSHPSSWEMEKDVTLNLSFWQRLKNFIRQWYHIYCVFNHFYPQHQALAEKYLGKYLGKDIPHIYDIERNMSVIFHNQEEVITYARPKTTNIIPFTGLHISKKPARLPKNLERFLMNAPDGFIYLSLGTNVRLSVAEHMIDIFRNVLANLPCKVLWKIDMQLSNKPDNIYISNWFPQQSILAHPKLRLFVYQGGLQSTEEAVYYAIPLLGIPMFADQFVQVNKMVSLGVARQLDYLNISEKSLNASIMDMLNDNRYKERMLKIKALIRDKPYDQLNNTIWWIEFVIRHKGAPHLQSSIAHYPWYQRYDMDIIAFLSIVIFVALLCGLIVVYNVVKIIFNCYAKTKKEKIN
ncbi:hypothetical protein DMN91_001181 [Ooceraea biroi]|uniref:Ecdysteroid UDP-glucosyltransferase n=1 Tax=Ooceraea biroi TaxID=2015173 RepID=A0A3L8E3Z6_OOCBI|nr:UDP-glucuronosyltransferase 2B19-like [Ooceraea biroi]RLU27377.1 hypothetical protein DMN91_001181 [Ooceraea biroi]